MYHIRKEQKYAVWITVFLFAITVEVVKTEVIHDNDTSIRKYKNNHCECIHTDCGCCAHIEWDAVSLNGTMCYNVSYLEHDYGFSVTVTYNNVVIINETLSARNPPPICIGESFIDDFPVEFCLRLYDIYINGTDFHCCFEMEAKLVKLNILPLHLGCVDTNSKNITSSDISLKSNMNIFQMTAYLFLFSIILAHVMTN